MIHDLYACADLFLFVSQTDTQGLVIAEAMAYAIPVITFEGPAQEDIIVNGYNGYVTKNSTEFAQQITNFLSDQSDELNFLRNGAFATAQRYKSSTIVASIVDLYTKTITNKN